MRKCLIILMALVGLVVVGCATLSKEDCQNMDWFTKGKSDGMNGEDIAVLGDYQQACSKFGIKTNDALYQKGRLEGLKLFCTYETGIKEGRAGHAYKGLCSGAAEKEFLRGHEVGMKDYQAQQEQARQKREAKERAKALAKAKLVECQIDSDCTITRDHCNRESDGVRRCAISRVRCWGDSGCKVGGSCVPDNVCIAPGNCFRTNTCRFMKMREVSY